MFPFSPRSIQTMLSSQTLLLLLAFRYLLVHSNFNNLIVSRRFFIVRWRLRNLFRSVVATVVVSICDGENIPISFRNYCKEITKLTQQLTYRVELILQFFLLADSIPIAIERQNETRDDEQKRN